MDTKIDYSALINLTQAARELSVSYMTIYRWRKSGKIKVHYIGGMPFVPLGEIVKLRESVNT